MRKKISKRVLRHKRVRAKISGTRERPRLSVFRSHKHLFLQLIDDEAGRTILGLRDNLIVKGKKKLTKADLAFEAGKEFAKLSHKKGIASVVFDRGGFRYQGRIKKVAEGLREGGLKF